MCIRLFDTPLGRHIRPTLVNQQPVDRMQANKDLVESSLGLALASGRLVASNNW